jgi:hypothetical protein
MKIFQLNTQGESEFISSESLIKAILFYHNLTGNNIEDFDDDDTIIEIPQKKWKDYKITNGDFDVNDTDDWQTKTFEEYMKDASESELICSTAY